MIRRVFLTLGGAAATGGALGFTLPRDALGANHPDQAAGAWKGNAAHRLRVLMLGGTGFLGPTIVNAFLDRGHEVTLFNRGLTNPHLFKYLERLKGDRENPDGAGIGALRGRNWDVVVDTWQKGPKCIEDTARLLSGHAQQYFYTSSIAVYNSYGAIGTTETARLNDIKGQPISRMPDLRYGLRKTISEKLITDHFDGAATIFRSHGMRGSRIAAPNDEPYWPVRIWRGGDVLTPGDGQSSGQFTDTISLTRFMTHCAEQSISGAFNVMSPSFHLKAYLSAIKRVTHSNANFVWTPRARLSEFGVEPYRDLPMWRPEPKGFYHFNADKAGAAGFRHRSLEACAASMLDGYFERRPNDDFTFGGPDFGTLSASREAEILGALR